MSSSSGNLTTSTPPTSYLTPSTSLQHENKATTLQRDSKKSTSSDDGRPGSYEVVYTEKTTEFDGSEDLITLHYAFDDTPTTTLFDEFTATESLLMLSEIRDNSRFPGITQ